jgi:hypothetical protein
VACRERRTKAYPTTVVITELRIVTKDVTMFSGCPFEMGDEMDIHTSHNTRTRMAKIAVTATTPMINFIATLNHALKRRSRFSMIRAELSVIFSST